MNGQNHMPHDHHHIFHCILPDQSYSQAVTSRSNMCNSLVISDINIRPPPPTNTNKPVIGMGQEKFEDNKMKNYGECKLKRASKIDEGEDDFEADFQAFSKKYDEEDESHYKFMALLPAKNGLTSVSTPTKGKVGLDFPMKGMIC